MTEETGYVYVDIHTACSDMPDGKKFIETLPARLHQKVIDLGGTPIGSMERTEIGVTTRFFLRMERAKGVTE